MEDYSIIKKRKIRKIKCEICQYIPDNIYLKYMFKNILGYSLNLKNPKTFNEKLNWLKLNNRKPEYTIMADKYRVKKYVSDLIGEEYVIPLLGVWDKYEDIDFDKLPEKFVLKPNNGCGDLLICPSKEDKDNIDHNYYKQLFDLNLSTKYYVLSREWPYKNIKPCIIAEEYMEDFDNSNSLSDYKFLCFNGEPKIMYVATDRNIDCRIDFYDMEFKHLDIYNMHPNSNKKITKPENFEKMKILAKELSKKMPFIRVDFYEIKNKIYFGEFTFFQFGGISEFKPNSWDYKLGEWLKLKND